MKNQIVLSETNSNVEKIKTDVLNSLGSLFTRYDVIKVIDMLVINEQVAEQGDTELMDEVFEVIRKLNTDVCGQISNADDNSNCVNYQSVEFEVNGTELSCSNIKSDLGNLESDVEELIDKAKVAIETIFNVIND